MVLPAIIAGGAALLGAGVLNYYSDKAQIEAVNAETAKIKAETARDQQLAQRTTEEIAALTDSKTDDIVELAKKYAPIVITIVGVALVVFGGRKR